ncbi:hypothetical protein B0H19DRAFT_1273588 [Mycena capillaripes]|nr:hypothetical protein B0H19DRAFT_1273588 [Mycena capillaripes]
MNKKLTGWEREGWTGVRHRDALRCLAAELKARQGPTLLVVAKPGFCLEALLRTENRWKRGAEISKPMLFFAVLMGCVSSFDTATSFVLSLRTLAFHDGFWGPNLPVEDSSGWLGVMGTVDVIVQTVLGDSMLNYRSYQTARRIVIDWGLMHTTVATATAIVYICSSNGYAALTGIDVQMIAISFNVILIRVHRKRAAALRPRSDFERPPASTLRLGVLHRTSPSDDTALGDLESNHNTRSLESTPMAF